ncbi:MAG TPA: threonine/serine exporter family protein, partial [Candidatus Ruthenibacterium merdipullorum]|nr:threonine/serine exporter family protein [Candidatus Ruthenibacterium merdipullorum]
MMAQLLVQCGVSFIAVLAFAILFHAPRREWAPCGLTGMVGWVVYWLAVQGGVSVVAASLYGTLALALLSRVLAVVRRCPVTVFLTGGIFPLVPGAGIYYTVYAFITGD